MRSFTGGSTPLPTEIPVKLMVVDKYGRVIVGREHAGTTYAVAEIFGQLILKRVDTNK